MQRFPVSLCVAAGLLGACSRPDGDVLFRPFREPNLHDGLPEAGVSIPDAGGAGGHAGEGALPEDASSPENSVDSGGEAPPADAGGDAGSNEGATRPDGALQYWGFDTAAELDEFQFYDWQLGSAREWHDADEHAPSGHFIVTMPFTGVNQGLQMRGPIEGETDFSGRSLKIRVRHLSGSGPGGLEGFAQSREDWVWTPGAWHQLTSITSFTVISFDFDTALVPAEVVRYGMHVNSTNAGTADNTHALIVDAFWIE